MLKGVSLWVTLGRELGPGFLEIEAQKNIFVESPRTKGIS